MASQWISIVGNHVENENELKFMKMEKSNFQ